MPARNASITLDDSIFVYESEVFLNSVSSTSSNEKPSKSKKKEKKDQENLRKLILKISEEGVFTEDDLYDAEAEIRRTRKLVLGQKSVQFEEMKERYNLLESAGIKGGDDETMKNWAQQLKDFTAREITRDELLRVATMLRDNPDAISTLPNTVAEIKPTSFKKSSKSKHSRLSLTSQKQFNFTSENGKIIQSFCCGMAFSNKFKKILWISVGIFAVAVISCGIYFAVEPGKTISKRSARSYTASTTAATRTKDASETNTSFAPTATPWKTVRFDLVLEFT